MNVGETKSRKVSELRKWIGFIVPFIALVSVVCVFAYVLHRPQNASYDDVTLDEDTFCGLVSNADATGVLPQGVTDYLFRNVPSTDNTVGYYNCELFSIKTEDPKRQLTIRYRIMGPADRAAYTPGNNYIDSELSVVSQGKGLSSTDGSNFVWIYSDYFVLDLSVDELNNSDWKPSVAEVKRLKILAESLIDAVPAYNRDAGRMYSTPSPSGK